MLLTMQFKVGKRTWEETINAEKIQYLSENESK
jgi:hypothetical protein